MVQPAATETASASAQASRGLVADARGMAQLTPRLVAFNVGYLALAWASALGAITLFWVLPRWYTFVFAFLVVSSRQQALLNCEHECVHRKLLPRKRWNDLVGTWLCAAPVGSPFGSAKARHLAHHRLLGTPDDPDRDLHEGPEKHTRGGLARHFLTGMLGGYAGMVLFGPPGPGDRPADGSARRDIVAVVLVQTALGAGLTLTFGWWVYPALWLAPLGTVTVLCHLVRSFVEHAITDTEANGRHANRLITRGNLLERSLVSPYYMNYHAEHHLSPAVPAPRLRRLAKLLAGREDTPPVLVRPSYGAAVRGYARSLPR